MPQAKLMVVDIPVRPEVNTTTFEGRLYSQGPSNCMSTRSATSVVALSAFSAWNWSQLVRCPVAKPDDHDNSCHSLHLKLAYSHRLVDEIFFCRICELSHSLEKLLTEVRRWSMMHEPEHEAKDIWAFG